MLKEDYFTTLRGCSLETSLKTGSVGAKNLQHILRQTVHYCIRYGLRTILLSDYESMVLLILDKRIQLDADGNVLISAQGIKPIWWIHISATKKVKSGSTMSKK